MVEERTVFSRYARVKGQTETLYLQSCPCALHEGIWGSGHVAVFILNLRTRWKGVISFTPKLLYVCLCREPLIPRE